MKNLVLLSLLIAFAAVFVVFWESPPEFFFGKTRTRVETLPLADSYMRNTVTSKFSEEGLETYTLEAQTGLYYNSEDRFELERPTLVSRARQPETSPPWHLQAREAHTSEGGQRVTLSGDVHAWQLSGTGKNELTTDELVFIPGDNTAETEQKVTFKYPGGNTSGVGMRANFTTETYQLLSQVRGSHYGR